MGYIFLCKNIFSTNHYAAHKSLILHGFRSVLPPAGPIIEKAGSST